MQKICFWEVVRWVVSLDTFRVTRYLEIIPPAWLVGLPEKWFWNHFDLSGFRVYQACGLLPSSPGTTAMAVTNMELGMVRWNS